MSAFIQAAGPGQFKVRKHRAATVLALAAASVVGRAVMADITGFSGFAPINTNGTFTNQQPNYSSNGEYFNTTDGLGSEAVSGFNTAPQLDTSFNAQFTFNASAGADGTAFVVQNAGLTALGTTGGAVGYAAGGGSNGITSSVAIKLNIYGTNSTQLGENGAFIGNATTATTLANSVPVTVNISYYGTTLSITETNPTTKTSASQSFTGVNIPTLVGANTALIGFSSGTGGVASTQQIGNFKFISNTTYSPIAINASSYNEDMIVEKNAPQTGATANITASMDQGTYNLNNNSWYEKGYDAAAPTTGLPIAGSTFTSQGDANHVYTMAPSYTANDAILVGASGTTSNSPSSATITFTNPAAYRALSFLTSSGNGPQGLQLTINYADGAPASVINDLVSPDWFGQGNLAYSASGRVVPGAANVSSSFNSVGSANPNLWEADVLLPDTTDPISSVTITNDTGGGRAAIFAVSGASVIGTDTLLYTGTGTPAASFDTTGSANYKLNGVAAAFITGDSVIYDDTATGSHTITVQAAGVTPTLLTFNNSSSSYSFTGGPIIKGAGVALNGSGTVTFNNTVTLTSATTITAGTLAIGGTYNTTGFLVSSGATLNVLSTGSLGGAPDLANSGTVNFLAPAVSVGSLTGAGTVNLNNSGGTTLTASGTNTAFTGSFGGTGGTFNLSAGTYTPPSASAIYSLTGGLNVGTVNGSNAALVINDNSGALGTNASSGMLTATLGPSGMLTTPTGTDGAWGGKIVLAATGGQASITGGIGNTININGPISGTGPVLLAGNSGATVNLNSASNTYTGETRITGNTSAVAQNAVNINANNAISPSSGLALINGNGGGFVTVSLNNVNQTVAYLSGTTTSTSSIYVNGTGVLTINGGSNAGSPQLFGVPIQGSLTLVKSGSGNQLLQGGNSYSGPTVITGGTLTPLNDGALSNTQVNLSGGSLSLANVGSTIAGTPQVSGFGNFTLTHSGTGNPGNVSGGTLNLTDANQGEANVGYTSTPVTLARAGFVANFLYSTNGGADGMSFIIQNDPRGTAAVGGSGGQLGYATGTGGALNGNNVAVNNSGAVLFNIYGAATTALGLNGNLGTFQGANLYSSVNPNPVSIVYNPITQLLTESITNGDSGTVNTFSYSGVNFTSLLNGSSGYIGFAGATGGVTSTQSVSNFSFGAVTPTSISISNQVVATSGNSSIRLGAGPGGAVGAIGGLTINSGANVALLLTNGSTGHAVLALPSLSIASGGSLDIQSNALDLASGGTGNDLTTVTGLVKTGYNNGAFNGSGISSSTAAADSSHLTAVGVIVNNVNGNPLYGSGTALGLFDSANPGSGDTLVKYTYFGDANLNGSVDGSDYSLVDYGFTNHLTGWYNGDFNYDGVVDGSDYTLMDNAFNQQSVSLAAQLATATAQVAGSAVPEPATLSLAMIGAVGLLGRRRRR